MSPKKLYFQTDDGIKNLDIDLNPIIDSAEEDDIVDMGLSMDISPQLDQAQQMIRDCAEYTLNSFKHFAAAEVNEIILKFGIELGGEAGIPYITKGTTKSNLEIEVKCTFPQQENN